MTPTTIAITTTRFVGVIPDGKENIRYSADFSARSYFIDLIGHQVIWTEHAWEACRVIPVLRRATAKERVDRAIKVPETVAGKEERYRLIEQENVRLQLEHLNTYPLLRKAVGEKRVEVHGLYYELATGALTRVT